MSVLYSSRDGVATITINRPAAMNSLDADSRSALRDALSSASDDSAVRAVVLTGAGRAFCVGQDLKEHAAALQAGSPSLGKSVTEHYNPIVSALTGMPKPVVAAVNGVAAGAGASFAFACDFRVVAQSAGFNLAFAAIGLSCDSGSSWTLPRLVGWAKARELLLRPRTVGADEAHDLGLATEVVADADVASRARELADELASGPTAAYGAIRRTLEYSASHELATSLVHEGELMSLTGATDDHREAVDAFLNKRQPDFHGQ